MATKSLAIVLPDTTALAKLPQFTEAVAQLNLLNGELSAIELVVKELKISDRVSFENADIMNKRAKQIVKEAEEVCKPYKTPLRSWLDLVQTQFNIVSNHNQQLQGILQPKMGAFSQQEAREAAAEKEKLQKDLNKQYRGTGTPVPEIEVDPNVRGGRTYFHAECINQAAYIEAVCKAYAKKDRATYDRLVLMLEVSNQRLNAEAKETANNTQMEKFYPFVRAWSDNKF